MIKKRCLTCITIANIKCRSLTRRKKNDGETYTRHTRHADKNHNNINNKNKMK